MADSVLVALCFALLLGFEWWRRMHSIRIIASVLALLVLLFAAPNYTAARRRAGAMPPAERVTHLRGSVLSEYYSGVLTMEREAEDEANSGAGARMLALGALLWLACSPALRRPSTAERGAAGDVRPGIAPE